MQYSSCSSPMPPITCKSPALNRNLPSLARKQLQPALYPFLSHIRVHEQDVLLAVPPTPTRKAFASFSSNQVTGAADVRTYSAIWWRTR